jgi:PAS domain S-box-containing protein
MHGWCHDHLVRGCIRVPEVGGAALACRVGGLPIMAFLGSLFRAVSLACVMCLPLPAQAPVAAPDKGGLSEGEADIRTAPAPAQAIASTVKTQADSGGKKSVLFLNSYHPGYEWSDEVYEAIHSVLNSEKFNLFTEYLDSQHYNGKEYTDSLEKMLRYKYGNSKIDAIIVSDHYAVRLTLSMRGTFHRGVPLVYLGIDRFRWEHREEYKPIYGLEEEDGGVFGTLDLIFSIHRNVKLIYLVADGDTESAPVMLNYVREVERSGKSGAIFKYLVGMSMEEVEAAIRVAPRDSVVVWLHFMKDKNGRLISVAESQKWLAGISPVPVYCPYGFQPGSGVMGGHIISGLAQGKRAAEIVLQIFEGRAPQTFYGNKAPLVTKLDYQVMRRFGIGLKDIPADSMVYNKPSSIFQKYRTQILGALTLIVVLSAMVVYLLLSLARRKKAEKALSESEERMTLAADAAEFGVWVWDITSNQVWGSERWQRLFGFASGEDVSFKKVIQRIHPDDRETVEREVRHALANGRNYKGEFRAVLPDGGQRWIVSRARIYMGVNRKPARMMGAAMDITDRKLAEGELKQIRLHLWHADRVAQTAAVAASLAHELNQPLGAILTNAEVGLRFMASTNPDLEEIREIFTDIIQDDMRAGTVVSGLRDLLRRKETRHEEINLTDTIRRTIELLHSELQGKQVQLHLALKPDSLVLADKVQIQQVILNLVMNAIEAMQDQPAGQRRLELTMTHTDIGEALVAVRDSGPGIPKDRDGKIFEAFRTTKQNGLGVGLMISRSIIESHKGRIGFANNPDKGVTFYFTLPLMVNSNHTVPEAG